jgi:hypothetical protein
MPGDELEEEDDTPATPRPGKGKRGTSAAGEGRSSSKSKSKPGTTKSASASKKPPVSKFAALRHSAYKALFGWLDPKFKRNGKKLLASSSIVWKFMVSCSSVVRLLMRLTQQQLCYGIRSGTRILPDCWRHLHASCWLAPLYSLKSLAYACLLPRHSPNTHPARRFPCCCGLLQLW